MAESSEGLVRVMLGEEEVEIPEALLEDVSFLNEQNSG